MESYQTWDVTIPPIPPRSRLYRLEPIGVEMPYVECLTSYIARLAEEHCVSLKALMMREIFPSQGLDFTEPHHYRHLSTFCEQNSSYLNDRDDFERQCWIAERVGELLAAARDLRVVTTKEQIATMLSLCVDQYAQGNVSVLARKMNVSPSCLWNYLHKDGLPFFDFLIRLCYTLSIPPLEFLTASSLPRRRYLSNPAKDLPEVSRCTGNRITQDDVRRMRHVLETLLAREGIARYPSLKEIAQWIGCRVETLRRYCPDLCRASVRRYMRQWVEDSARVRMREALESALAGGEPISLMAVARQLGCAPETLRNYFPELCQAIVARNRGRFDYQRIQQRLQEMLASNEEVPSVTELARQLGYSASLIWKHFTDLCKRISARYLAQKRKRREERVRATCEEIRQAVLLLHNQGIYPGAKRVSHLLKNRHSVRTFEGHEAWRLMLAELGYPTDAIKRYA